MGSPFSNSVSEANAGGDAYIRALLERLGSRDPLAVLRELPDALRGAVGQVDDTTLRVAEGAGKWSVLEVLAHLADIEIVSGYRARMIVAHDEPEIQAFDQDAWAHRLGYNDADLLETITTIEVLRHANLQLFRRLTADDLQRAGMHAERGRETLDRFLRLLAGHDLVHRDQIARILRTHGIT